MATCSCDDGPYVAPKGSSVELVTGASAQEGASPEGTSVNVGSETSRTGSIEWHGVTVNTDVLSPLEGVVDFLNEGIGKIESVVSAFQVVLKILELFVSAFSAFSGIVNALVGFVQNSINQWVEDLAGAGIYFTALVPPALRTDLTDGKKWQKLATGGFQGFLSRLSVSMYNKEDPLRPQFSDSAPVGGFIFLVDADSFQDFFSNLKTLANNFDFIDLLPIMTEPPPPGNVRGVSGYDEEGKFGVKLTWDAPTVRTGQFRVSRSIEPGGKSVSQDKKPTKLKDFFAALGERRRIGRWPKERVRVYDPIAVVESNKINGTGEYVDYDIDEKRQMYYYVIESGYGSEDSPSSGFWGPRSFEEAVPIEKTECVDPDEAQVVQHENGELELIGAGYGGLGSWSAINASLMIPFVPTLLKYFNKFADTLKGMTENVDLSFGTFVEGIVEKFNKYKDTLELMSLILERILSIDLGTVAWLYIPPEAGGVKKFLENVRTAKPVDDIDFSGPSGITAGFVFVFGAYNADPFGNTDTSVIEGQVEALKRVFDSFGTIFGD